MSEGFWTQGFSSVPSLTMYNIVASNAVHVKVHIIDIDTQRSIRSSVVSEYYETANLLLANSDHEFMMRPVSNATAHTELWGSEEIDVARDIMNIMKSSQLTPHNNCVAWSWRCAVTGERFTRFTIVALDPADGQPIFRDLDAPEMARFKLLRQPRPSNA